MATADPANGYRGFERQQIERTDLIHPNPARRRESQRCDGLRKSEGGDRMLWHGTATAPMKPPFQSSLTATSHPKNEHHQVIRETTNQMTEVEKKMFPVDGQLGPFHLADTLRVVNFQTPGGMFPLESATTTGELQDAVLTQDVRLQGGNGGWAGHTRLVPSHTSIHERRETLKQTGHMVELPPHQRREDNSFHTYGAGAVTSEAKAAFTASGFKPTETAVDTMTETKYRRAVSEFRGHDGRPEMFNF